MGPLGRRALAVVDVGFGDAGKGLVTDYLVRRLGAATVVRLGGGAQAGHNVITPDGRHHCFSQWGAGTFTDGVRTWLGPRFVLHPTALRLEAAHLEQVGVRSPLRLLGVHASALVVTPPEQAMGRLRERVRGRERHGSCGVGIGEVMRDEALGVPVVRAAILGDRLTLTRTLRALWEHKRTEWQALAPPGSADPELAEAARLFEEPRVLDRWVGDVWPLASELDIVDDEEFVCHLASQEHILFEGAQGVLLDQDYGFFPYVTFGRCTFADAEALGLRIGLDEPVTRIGVIRSYAVRHGPGPMPSEQLEGRARFDEPHNVTGPYQDRVRYGVLDPVLLDYSRRILGHLDALVTTHLDCIDSDWAWVEAYRSPEHARHLTSGTSIPVLAPHDFEARAELSSELLRAGAVSSRLGLDRKAPGVDLAARLAARLGAAARLGSFGPRATDVVDWSA